MAIIAEKIPYIKEYLCANLNIKELIPGLETFIFSFEVSKLFPLPIILNETKYSPVGELSGSFTGILKKFGIFSFIILNELFFIKNKSIDFFFLIKSFF